MQKNYYYIIKVIPINKHISLLREITSAPNSVVTFVHSPRPVLFSAYISRQSFLRTSEFMTTADIFTLHVFRHIGFLILMLWLITVPTV